MKVITFEDIRKLNIAPKTCYQWVEEMIEDKASVILPAKISMKPMDGVFCNVMPSIISRNLGQKDGGVKIVTRYPNRMPSLDSELFLFDALSGEMKAVMDANWITAMRTGAVASHSIKLFAKTNFTTIGIMGLGNTARATLAVLADIYPEREFRIKLLKYKQQEVSFQERFSQNHHLYFEMVDTIPELVKGSDVVISAVTYFSEDICDDKCFDEGMLLVPIHTRGFTNCDLFFDKVFADDTGHVCGFKNFSKFRSFAEVSEVVKGVKPGRENDSERIIAYNIGLSMRDINFAAHIFDLVTECESIDLLSPSDKFWV